ncbi:MAG: MXAN_2755 family glutamic-type intramembrane protease [Archangium sp.]|nr:MXAN_2755 family glutamic-type intramembrane protease [Archangium sp.]
MGESAAREAFAIWGVCFAATLIAYQPWKPAAKIVATIGFLYLPLYACRRRGEDWPDFGLSMRTLGPDVRQFLAVSAVVFPLFIAGYLGFTLLWPSLPPDLMSVLTPYTGGTAPRFELRLPDRFTEWVIDDLFVVALPEEFFYRGYIQSRLRDAWPRGRLFFGARLGPAFWVTAVLFALGHLAIFQVWRLGVFFPALLFGWMRERSNSVVGPALFHAAANLLIKVLDASFFGRV